MSIDQPPPWEKAKHEAPEGGSDSTPEAWLQDLKVAAIFFTRVPIQHDGPLALGDLARAWRAAPVIGAAIGLAGGVAFNIAYALYLPAAIAGLLAVLATAALTGALHEDGLADCADGCGGGDAERRIEIMRDSRTGAYGALALIFSVGLRAAALAAMAGPFTAVLALVAAHAASRAAMPAVMDRLEPAQAQGLGAGAGKPDRTALGIAVAVAAILTLIVLGVGAGIAALLGACIAAAIVALVAQRLLGGYTGDVLGAVQQAVEIAVLLAAAAFIR